jgi:hypothetical protein
MMVDMSVEMYELLKKSIACYKQDIANYPASEINSPKPRKLKDLKDRLAQLEKQAHNANPVAHPVAVNSY